MLSAIALWPSKASAEPELSLDTVREVLPIQRYVKSELPTETELALLKKQCETTKCYVFPAEQGLTPLNQFVYLAARKPEEIPEILTLPKDIAANPDPVHSKMQHEPLKAFLADLQASISSIELEKREPGKGVERRGLLEVPHYDCRADFTPACRFP